ncbi:hypothetical protein Pfo_002467 [Paulownia fortunei]|nr:hypothetical protein Pfo_002467 [Paulownia fortunei]
MTKVLSTLLLLLNNILGNSDGLTLELIDPNSQESSFSRSNFSYEERIQRLVSQSLHRTNYLSSLSVAVPNNSTSKHAFLEIARPLVDLQEFIYIVKIGIGTFKSKPPFKDTFTWMQCEGCTKCFNQKPKPFPNNNSTSFHPILDEDNKPFLYNIIYQDGTNTSGIVAKETIHLKSNTSSMKSVQDFIFGCGLVNNVEYDEFKNNRVAGVMGLGWGIYSFVNQIRESKGRFSYCLPVVNSLTKARPKTYLRFGDDIVQGHNGSSTSMMKVEGVGTYYVGLQGISFNRKRLNISTDVFALKIDGPNGPKGLELCYEHESQKGIEGWSCYNASGGFEVGKRFKSHKFRQYFCLAMIRYKRISLIGVHKQTNQRIIYDTQKKKLVFHSEDCSKNS